MNSQKLNTLSLQSLAALEWPFIQDALSQRARSTSGKTLCQTHQPYSNLYESHSILKRITEVRKIFPTSPLHSFLSELQNPGPFFERTLKNGTLDAQELFICAHFIESLAFISIELQQKKEETPILYSDFEHAPNKISLANQIKKSVSSDGTIYDDASPALLKLRSQRVQLKHHFEKLLSQKVKTWHQEGLLQDDFYDVHDGRYVVPVKIENQSQISGILLGRSNTGQSAFIEPLEWTSSNNELKELEISIQAEERRILQELSNAIQVNAESLMPWIDQLTQLDFICSAVQLSLDWNLCLPEISKNSSLFLRNFYHPALFKTAIKNSLEFTKEQCGLIISGPNTGGKTVLLKAIGLCITMANAGLYVPAAEAKIPEYLDVFALIGDDQNIQEGLSSFSAQILDFNKILSSTKAPALILIDEILSSTNPEDASTLAQAFLEECLHKGHHIFITTHFSDLTMRCRNDQRLIIAAMEFLNHKPSYRLKIDEIGSSHAFEIAQSLGMPEKILARAKALTSQAKQDYEKEKFILKEKEQHRQNAYEQALNQLEKIKSNLEQEYQTKTIFLQKQLSHFIEKSEEKMNQTIKTISERLQTYLRQGVRPNTEVKIVNSVQSKLSEIKKEAVEFAADHFNKKQEELQITVGCMVKVQSLGKAEGKVLELKEKDGVSFAIVQVGNFKSQKPLTDLQPFVQTKPLHHYAKSNIQFETEAESIPPKLDVRGKRFDEALIEVEQYLDRAFRNKIIAITIITGHGTGSLKKGVKTLLSQLPYIKNFKPERENDDGAFYVEFDL